MCVVPGPECTQSERQGPVCPVYRQSAVLVQSWLSESTSIYQCTPYEIHAMVVYTGTTMGLPIRNSLKLRLAARPRLEAAF